MTAKVQLAFGCVALALLALARTAGAWESAATDAGVAMPPAEPKVDFERDIRPILAKHCFQCHGEREQHANLRLDDRARAIQGGDSGKKLIDVPLGDNELLRRVTDNDVEVRMPLEGPPLSAAELDLIRQWATQGGHWPDPQSATMPMAATKTDATTASESWYWKIIDWLQPVADFCTPILDDYGSFLYATLGLLLVVGLVERGRNATTHEGWEEETLSPIWSLCRYVPYPLYVIALLILLGWGFFLHTLVRDRQEAELAKQIKQLNAEIAGLKRLAQVDPSKSYDPPRPSHPKRLGGEYYRGNDERSAALYNGGFYRTATFRLALCDQDRKQLHVGDPVPSGKLLVKLEIERAQGASHSLFTKSLMSTTFLSRHKVEEENVGDLKTEVAHLETVKEGDAWVAYYPLAVPTGADRENVSLTGNITLYNGPLNEKKIDARPHFGIVYDLRFEKGKIAADSDLWMGSLYYWWPLLEIPTPGRVPLHEWFDFRPIPEIEGQNTKDPALLGVPEHVKPMPKPEE